MSQSGATRIHMDLTRPESKHFEVSQEVRQSQVIRDCTEPVKGHATWVMPSVDIDELVSLELPCFP